MPVGIIHTKFERYFPRWPYSVPREGETIILDGNSFVVDIIQWEIKGSPDSYSTSVKVYIS